MPRTTLDPSDPSDPREAYARRERRLRFRRELRLRCIEAAAQFHAQQQGRLDTVSDVLRSAREFYAWIEAGEKS